MAFIGLVTTNPIFGSAILDRSKWRSVIYADTPKCMDQYARWKSSKKDSRKVIVHLIGASNLSKVLKDESMFHSIIVYDDLETMSILSDIVGGLNIADVEEGPMGPVPFNLSQAALLNELKEPGGFPDTTPFLSKVRASFGNRKPSVLESSSNMPTPEESVNSGVQRMMTGIKEELEIAESSLPFAVVVDCYSKFIFGMVTRGHVTATVTKKLPKGVAKELWQSAMDMATSQIGLRMKDAYKSLCVSQDPDYRANHAVTKFDLKPYSGDFIYLISILPPSSHWDFIESE